MSGFLKVGSLLSAKPGVVFAETTDSLRATIHKMKQHEYSQLPVYDRAGKCAGIITADEICRQMLDLDDTSDLLDRPVIDFLTESGPLFVASDEDLVANLARLSDSGVLLVGKAPKIEGILTSFDALRLFRQTAQPFLILQDVEIAIRDVVKKLIPDRASRAHRIRELDKSTKNTIRENADLDDLDFEDLRQLVVSNWDLFGANTEVKMEYVNDLLGQVRKLRNKICHFRGPLNSAEEDSLLLARRQVLQVVDGLTSGHVS